MRSVFSFAGLVGICLVVISALAAQQTDSTPPADSTKLQAIKAERAVYPLKAWQDGIQGEVLVEVHVNENGDVVEADVVSGDPVLAESAVAAARKWKFNPFIKNGKPIPVSAKLPFDFYFEAKEMENGRSRDGSATGAIPPATASPSAPSTQQAPSEAGPAVQRVGVSQGVAEGLLVHQIAPIYPPKARADRIQGTVVLKAIIDKTGHISSLEPVSGPKQLVPAAVGAVQQWRYRPYILQGQPVEVQTTITVHFQLQ